VSTHLKVRGRALGTMAVAACIGSMAGTASVAQAQETAPSQEANSSSEPRVVSVRRVVPPRRKVVRVRFRPWSRPSPRKVRQIIRIEARRWHIDPRRLARRVGCESEFRWYAGNGSYRGLLQFAPSTFSRGLRTIRSRRVAIVKTRVRTVRETQIVRYSDGRVERRRGRRHRQRVVRLYRGVLPRRPQLTHGWAQLRIGSQAIRGMSAVRSSEWGCPA
jgi:hypothetical protein